MSHAARLFFSAVAFAAVALVGVSCASSGNGGRNTAPKGPPEIQDAVVSEHASQFDDKLGVRRAGSQQEFAASTYILGHLQQAGYAPLLDPVPVQDLIRSTNVVADPPRGGDPTVIVAIPYDTGANASPSGIALGTWLELARALYARSPDHGVGFVALGAEYATVGGGELGSRRLAEYLLDRGIKPLVLTLGPISTDGETFGVSGKGVGWLLDAAKRLAIPEPNPGELLTSDAAVVFDKAGFAQGIVSGSVDGVGRVLLEALSTSASPASSTSTSPR